MNSLTDYTSTFLADQVVLIEIERVILLYYYILVNKFDGYNRFLWTFL